MLAGRYEGDATLAALAAPATAERIEAEWEATKHLPSSEREQAQDLLVIKYGPTIQAMQRAHAVATSPNVISFVDRRAKLPKGL